MMSMAGFFQIISYGRIWWGQTNSQIACILNSNGLLDAYSSTTPATTTRLALGIGRFGYSYSFR